MCGKYRRPIHSWPVVLPLLLAACGGGSSSMSGSGGNPPAGSGSANVLTYHNDNARDGLNAQETVLTSANVNSADFGKIAFFSMDGRVDAQPLYVSALNVGGTTHNVVFAASEHDSVYAFDADSGQVLWQVSLLGAGETPSDDRGCNQVSPEIGVTATPVIDPQAGPHGTIYVVAMSKDANGNYFQRLHALDLASGAEQPGSPVTVQAKYPGTGDNSSNGYVVFDPAQYKERPGLLLLNGVVYTFWSSHCDFRPYTGWIMGYNENSLAQTSVLDITPNGSEASIWASGAGPAADANGNIYFLAANGSFETTLDANGFPVNHDYGNAFLKLSTAGGTLAVNDYFNMAGTVAESNVDEDLGSGGAMLLPDVKDASGTLRHLAVGAGKDQTIYVVNRDNMGKFNPTTDNIWQEIPNGLGGGEYGMPAYFNATVYYGAVGDVIRAFPLNNALLATTPAAQTTNSFVYPGATPSISANGSANGIVWAVENSDPAVLYAYDATNLAHELYDSNQAGTRDQFGPGNKFITPTIANGKVYIGTTNGVAVFGLLH
ncbi:MAG TPA: pyrrolo-quinoline quinone [Gammaproteobacteria bacterium]|nr:pyrrolo-quinoline quinone [Gammaproteobacteria bacterium]